MSQGYYLEEHNTRYKPERRLSQTPILQDKHWSFIQRKYLMSPRELEIAKLVCRGLSNNQIASDLTISNGTVKTHLRNIYRKVRVNSKLNMLLNFIVTTSHLASRPQNSPLAIDISKTTLKKADELPYSYKEMGILP